MTPPGGAAATPEPGFAGLPYGRQNFAGQPYSQQNRTAGTGAAPGQAAYEVRAALPEAVHDAMTQARDCRAKGDCENCTARYDAVMNLADRYATAAAAAQPAPTARCLKPHEHSDNLTGAVVDCNRPEHHEPAPGGELAALGIARAALREIALGVELNALGGSRPIDPSVHADKALVAIRKLREGE